MGASAAVTAPPPPPPGWAHMCTFRRRPCITYTHPCSWAWSWLTPPPLTASTTAATCPSRWGCWRVRGTGHSAGQPELALLARCLTRLVASLPDPPLAMRRPASLAAYAFCIANAPCPAPLFACLAAGKVRSTDFTDPLDSVEDPPHTLRRALAWLPAKFGAQHPLQ